MELHYTKMHADMLVVVYSRQAWGVPRAVKIYRDGVLVEYVPYSSGSNQHGCSYEGVRYTAWLDHDTNNALRIGYSNAGTKNIGSSWDDVASNKVRTIHRSLSELVKRLPHMPSN